jgi:hypothetical protein
MILNCFQITLLANQVNLAQIGVIWGVHLISCLETRTDS